MSITLAEVNQLILKSYKWRESPVKRREVVRSVHALILTRYSTFYDFGTLNLAFDKLIGSKIRHVSGIWWWKRYKLRPSDARD